MTIDGKQICIKRRLNGEIEAKLPVLGGLTDYKIFCFDGCPKYIQVDYDRFVKYKRNLYTTDWEYLDMTLQLPTDKSRNIPKPANLDEMLNFAGILAKGIPHVRCDFYSVAGKMYFGEMTFFHGGGFEKFTPSEWDNVFGDLIKLKNIDHS